MDEDDGREKLMAIEEIQLQVAGSHQVDVVRERGGVDREAASQLGDRVTIGNGEERRRIRPSCGIEFARSSDAH